MRIADLPHMLRPSSPRGLLALAVLITLAGTTPTVRAQLKPGDAFPSLASAQLSGGTVPATTGKILIVDFWASWCAPCKASFPSLGRIAAEYASRDVVLVGVSVDENPDAYAAFLRKFSPRFPALHDARQSLVRAVQAPTMPTTYVIDRQGRVHSIHTGYHGEASDRRLRADIEALLAAKG